MRRMRKLRINKTHFYTMYTFNPIIFAILSVGCPHRLCSGENHKKLHTQPWSVCSGTKACFKLAGKNINIQGGSIQSGVSCHKNCFDLNGEALQTTLFEHICKTDFPAFDGITF